METRIAYYVMAQKQGLYRFYIGPRPMVIVYKAEFIEVRRCLVFPKIYQQLVYKRKKSKRKKIEGIKIKRSQLKWKYLNI